MLWLEKMIFIAAFFSSATAFAEPQDYAQVLNSYLNQKLIMRSFGEAKNVKAKAGNLKQPSGDCYVAVEVMNIRAERKKIVFQLQVIGRVRAAVASRCVNNWTETTFTISDLGDIAAQGLASDLQDVFLTPEAYLANIGHPLNPGQSAGNGPMNTPRVVLEITPMCTDEARRHSVMNGGVKSLVVVKAIVGADGKIHSPGIVRDPGYGLGEQSLRVLPLWRFESARKGDKAIDFETYLEFSFASY